MRNVVFLPGMMCDERLFAPQALALAEEFSIRYPGLTGADTIDQLARNVLAQAPDRFALAGLSMGGIVAMEILRQAPERVDRLALLDTNALADPPENRSIRNRQIEDVVAGKLRAVMRDELKPNYLADGPRRNAILELCMAMAMDLGADVFIEQSKALRDRHDQRETLRGCKVPTLVLRGEADTLCSLEKHQIIRDCIPGSELVTIPDAGHLPTLENPDPTNEALLKWLTN